MIVDKSIFRWDGYSDQPATLDRRVKRRLRWRGIGGLLRNLSTVFLLPRPVLGAIVRRESPRAHANDDTIGLCVNLERPFEDKKILSGAELAEILGTLNLRRIAVRIPLSDIDNLQDYVDFIRQFLGVPDPGGHPPGPQHHRRPGEARVVAGEALRVPCRHCGLLPDRQRRQPAQVGIRVRRRVVRVLQGGLGSSQPEVSAPSSARGCDHRLRPARSLPFAAQRLPLRLRRLRRPALRRPARCPREPADGIRPGGQDPRAASDHREREQGGRGRCAAVDHGGQLAA